MVTLAYCLMGRRLSATILTAPMVFIGLGFGFALFGEFGHLAVEHTLHTIAEIALVLLLFLDAAKTNLATLRNWQAWPARMLLIGLPLAMLLGTVMITLVGPPMTLAAAAMAAAILSPTDAALGQPVVSNLAVPPRERQTLTVESGLNDGLALPLILMFASLAAGQSGDAPGYWLFFTLKQVLLGPLAGIGLGWLGARAFLSAHERGFTERGYEGIAAIALAGGAYVLADLIGGNGFIAAFSAGMIFGHVAREQAEFLYEFTENEGQMLAWLAFFLIGLGLMPDAIRHLTPKMLLVILLSLFVIRPAAIWLSLTGTDARPRARLFLGWFGPRGLATALFALLVIPGIDPLQAEPLLFLAVNAVWISALLHGITAAPGARFYGSGAAVDREP